MRTGGVHTVGVAALLVVGLIVADAARAGVALNDSSDVPKGLKAPPTSESLWRAPDLKGIANAITAEKEPEADAQKEYELAELIDLAERINPETKAAWEQAKQAAAAVGLAQSQYYPVLALQAAANYAREPVPVPLTATSAAFMDLEAQQVSPVATLEWVLLDFGRR